MDLPFPRAVRTFVGREPELARIQELISREPLFFVCGIAGVGKSELVFKSIERARETERWRDAAPVFVSAEPGMEADQLVALLGARLGGATVTSVAGEHAGLARTLEDRPSLVFIDDAHHVDPASLSQLLATLSRHVISSRVFVASRLDIPVSPTAGAPVTIRLGSLSSEETEQMVELLAERLGIDAGDSAAIYSRSRGSPFFVQRELVAGRNTGTPAPDSIADSLGDLSDADRSVLLAASLLHGRVALADLDTVLAGEAVDVGAAVGSLSRRFLIDVDREVVVVHDLIRDVAVKQATEDELHTTLRAAAQLHHERFAADPKRIPFDIIEAIRYLVSAGDHSDAWQLIERWYRRIAAAGLDHLLLAELRALRNAMPDAEISIELLESRILIRRSLIAEAEALLRRIGRRPEAKNSFRYLFLRGEVALRAGQLARADELFEQATAVAAEATDRFQASLEQAGVASLRGDSARASELLDAAIKDLEFPSARHRGRWGWSRAASFALAGRFEAAASAAREAAAAIRGQGLEDLEARLVMIETIALVQCDEIAAARERVSELSSDEATGALREYVALLGRGAVLFGEGDMRAALVTLRSAFEHFDAHGDFVNACIAGFHLSVAHGALGENERSISAVLKAIATARAAGAVHLVSHGLAFHARQCIAAGDFDSAREAATAALDEPRTSARPRLAAHSVLAVITALEGGDPTPFLDRARECLQDDADRTLAFSLALDCAEVSLLAGELDAAIESGELARDHYSACGRRHDEACAEVILAAAHTARGGEVGYLLAEKALARVDEIARAPGYRSILIRASLIDAALAQRRGDSARARELLVASFRELAGTARDLEAAMLRCALDRQVDAPAGMRKLLRSLGFHGADSDRYADCDLVVDVDRGLIVGRRGAKTIKGRPVTCRVLAVLVDARGSVVTPETLYRRAWGADEYHALRHRNALYVAVNRARRALHELFGGQDLIENAPGGWRLRGDLTARCSGTG